ncbi:MAG TPA: hypothetical protein VML91_08520 [Burkholderiales bacterium]|nr:hypothetical protein [Burkholderiales bacterium]
MRAAWGVALAAAATAASAQAPATDRQAAKLELDEAQRKVEFTRTYSLEADKRLGEAERAATSTASARKGAERAAAEARKHDEDAQRALANAKKAAADARAAYQQAAEDFERLRKQPK